MTIERHPVVDRASWLELRKRDCTASAAAALIGAHERTTALGLFLDKTGMLPLDNGETPAMKRGRLLENVAADLLREMYPAWKIEAPAVYLRDPEVRLGATPDLYVHDERGRFGIIEVKTIEPSIFHRQWRQPGGAIEPPMAAVIQVIINKHLAEAEFCAVAAMRVGHGIDLDVIPLPDDTSAVYERVRSACVDFWKAVEERMPPAPDFERDAQLLLRLADVTEGETIDLTDDNELPEMAARDHELAGIIKSAELERGVIKGRLVHKMCGAAAAVYRGRVVAEAKKISRAAYMAKASEYVRVGFKGRSND